MQSYMFNLILRFFAFFALLILSPLILISMICVLIEDGMPMIFSQKRLGKDLKDFQIYKIRTMKKNTPEKGTHEISSKNFLYIGNFLRKSKIDELPQIFNYIKGDINLVGPRPGLVNQIKLKEERLRRNIYIIKPGITGLSQVLGYDMSDPAKLSKVDEIYINKSGFLIDFSILIATFIKSFRSKIFQIYSIELSKINNGDKHV